MTSFSYRLTIILYTNYGNKLGVLKILKQQDIRPILNNKDGGPGDTLEVNLTKEKGGFKTAADAQEWARGLAGKLSPYALKGKGSKITVVLVGSSNKPYEYQIEQSFWHKLKFW